MFHNNVFFVFFMAYCLLYSIGDCHSVARKKLLEQHRVANRAAPHDVARLDCSQFENDAAILQQLPFPVELVHETYGYEQKSTARMSNDGTFVESLMLRHETNVPASVFCLSNLTSLYIESTPFENDIVPDDLTNLKNLKYLNIIHVSVKQITEKLATLTDLEALLFYNCSLTHLPDIRNLQKLHTLYLSFNKLDANQINQVLDLNIQALDLSGNNLTQIPILKNKTNLVYLALTNNPLKNADSIVLYPNLRYLYLSDAMLTSIPSDIDKLTELNQVLLDRNQLTELPASIFNLSNLQGLSVFQNLFTPEYIQLIKEKFQATHPTIMLFI